MDFNPIEAGKFLSGSNDAQILFWAPVPGGRGGGVLEMEGSKPPVDAGVWLELWMIDDDDDDEEEEEEEKEEEKEEEEEEEKEEEEDL